MIVRLNLFLCNLAISIYFLQWTYLYQNSAWWLKYLSKQYYRNTCAEPIEKINEKQPWIENVLYDKISGFCILTIGSVDHYSAYLKALEARKIINYIEEPINGYCNQWYSKYAC